LLKLKFNLFHLRVVLSHGLCVVLCFCAIGCKRQRAGTLSLAQVHQVTQEFAKTASDAAPNGTLIKERRARNDAAGGGADELYIGLHGNAAARDQVLQRLEGIARQHGLTVEATTGNGNSSRITMRGAGVVTHHVEIEVLGARAAGSSESLPAGTGRLAILLDDLGSDRSAADAIFALRVPITLSVLPYQRIRTRLRKKRESMDAKSCCICRCNR